MNTKPKVLATDLDGTLIPDGPHTAQALSHLSRELRQHAMQLIFVTGRHLNSVQQAIVEYELPAPDWILCDVGTSIYQRLPNGDWHASTPFQHQLESISQSIAAAEVVSQLGPLPYLTLQEPEKQNTYKLSYYGSAANSAEIEIDLRARLSSLNIPYGVTASIDPFTGEGLFDLLPQGVSKAYALYWWLKEQEILPECILYAGDSGNDSAVFLSGIPCIIVDNAPAQLKAEVLQHHKAQGWRARLYIAAEKSTQGVLAGVRYFTGG